MTPGVFIPVNSFDSCRGRWLAACGERRMNVSCARCGGSEPVLRPREDGETRGCADQMLGNSTCGKD